MNGHLPNTTSESREKTDDQRIFKLDQILENEELVRKEVSGEQDSPFRAFSDGLYFTPNYYRKIKDQLIRYLSNLITTNTIPPKLGIFRGNSVLWSDYLKNPSCPDFLKINIELFSLAYSVRVVVYTVTTDGNLTAKIFNNKFDKTIQFINTYGAHLDVIYTHKNMEIIGICQNIVLNLIERVLEGKQDSQDYEWKDFSSDQYITTWLCSNVITSVQNESALAAEWTQPQLKRTKSASDLDSSSAKGHLQHYKMFVDSKPCEEISKIIERDVPDFSLVNESVLSQSEKSNASDGQPNLGLGYRKSFPDQKRVILSDEDEELLPPDSIRLEKSKSYIDPQKSAMHFTNFNPPGLAPNRYSTKTYGSETLTQTAINTDFPPTRHRFSESHNNALLQENPQHQSNVPKTKTTPRNLGLTTHSEEFNRGPGHEGNQQIIRSSNPRTSEKKKPVVVDESQHRYTGKLKFFDEGKSYGFIVMDDDGSDIFVHYDDLHKANINKDALKAARFGNAIRLSFNCMEYIGKYNKSRKATDIQFLA